MVKNFLFGSVTGVNLAFLGTLAALATPFAVQADVDFGCSLQASSLTPAEIVNAPPSGSGEEQHYNPGLPLLTQDTHYIGFDVPESVDHLKVYARSSDGSCQDITKYFFTKGHQILSKSWGPDGVKEYPSMTEAKTLIGERWMTAKEDGAAYNADSLRRPDLSRIAGTPHHEKHKSSKSSSSETTTVESGLGVDEKTAEVLPLYAAAMTGQPTVTKHSYAITRNETAVDLNATESDTEKAQKDVDGPLLATAPYKAFAAKHWAGAYDVQDEIQHKSLADIREHNLRNALTTEEPFWYPYAGGHMQLFVETRSSSGIHHYLTEMVVSKWHERKKDGGQLSPEEVALLASRPSSNSPNPVGSTVNNGGIAPPTPSASDNPILTGGQTKHF